jgi:hypothetical protein
MTTPHVPTALGRMSEQALRQKHDADEASAAAPLEAAMRQEGVAFLILESGGSRSEVFAERSRLFEVLGLQTSDLKARGHVQRLLERVGLQKARLERGDGSAPVEFLSLIDVASAVGECSQHPAMVARRAADARRAHERTTWYHQQDEARRARRRRLAPAPKPSMPFNVDAFAEVLGFYDMMADLRSRGMPDWDEARDGPRPQRWFMSEDGLSMVVRDGQLILDDWRDEPSDDVEIPVEAQIREITFTIPRTAGDAWRQLIQAGYWPDEPAERDDFLWSYREALSRHHRSGA